MPIPAQGSRVRWSFPPAPSLRRRPWALPRARWRRLNGSACPGRWARPWMPQGFFLSFSLIFFPDWKWELLFGPSLSCRCRTRRKKIRAFACERGIPKVLQNASGNAQFVLYVVFSRRHRQTSCRSSSSWSVLCTYGSSIAALLSIFSFFSWTTNTLSLWSFLGGFILTAMGIMSLLSSFGDHGLMLFWWSLFFVCCFSGSRILNIFSKSSVC